MLGDAELRSLVRRFITDDASQRVGRIVTGLRAQRKEVKWDLTCPKYGIVDSIRELPDVSPDYQPGKWFPFHFQWNGRVHWLDLPMHGHDGVWSGYTQVFSTYRHTVTLDHAIWCEYAADPYGPQVPDGHSIEPIGNKRSDHEKLLENGVTCDLVYFRAKDDVLSVDRQYSVSFIRNFGLPGQQVVKFDTLDAQIQYLNGLGTESGPDAQQPVGGEIQDHSVFLKKLKAQCYGIKDEAGPFASKYAFEIYKSTARYLTDPEERIERSA